MSTLRDKLLRPLFVLLISVVSLTVALVATPGLAAELPFQGVLRSDSGGPVADGSYILFVKLYDAVDAEFEIWEESLKGIAVQQGFFAAVLGLNPNKTIPNALLASGAPVWVGVQVGVEPELPRVPLRGVPWAWHAKTAAAVNFNYATSASQGGAATGIDCSGCITGALIADATIADSKLAFSYAGSSSKGGPATSALSAAKADIAAVASEAIHAKAADQATIADEAVSLQCTGCVQLKALSAQVMGAFVSANGGAITGDLTVSGSVGAANLAAAKKVTVGEQLDLGDAEVTGGQYAAVDIKAAVCDAKTRGRVLFDNNTSRLHVCDGAIYQRLSVCSTACLDAALVTCGGAIPDQCGDVGGCEGKGSLCPKNFACIAEKCEQTLACDAAVGSKVTYTGSGSWKVPGDVTSVRVLVVGGGGGGAKGHGNGGGSGHVRKGTYAVTPCETIAITVGTGGAYNSGGQLSKFGNQLTAQSGSAGQQNSSGSGAGGSGGGGAGNSGAGGDGGSNGSSGQSGQTYGGGAGGNFDAVTGGYYKHAAMVPGAGGSKGSSSHAGGGGGGGVLIDGDGGPGGNGAESWSAKGGKGYGAGGGGGGYNGPYANGGTGANGVVYIEWD